MNKEINEVRLKEAWIECSERCVKCREERDGCSKYEKDKNKKYCPPVPGCGDYKENVDVFLLTKGHGGIGEDEYFIDNNFEKLREDKLQHYTKRDPYDNFHSFLMRSLIKKIEEEKKNWYLTDIWKCFVIDRPNDKKWPELTKNDIKNNLRKSFENCNKYLIKEIEILKPKVIVLFGNDVKNFYKEQIKENLNHKPVCVESMFPGTRTADKWFGKSKNNPSLSHEKWLIEDIKEKLDNLTLS